MKRELKGKSIIDFPCDYTVIDTAATSYFLGNEIADQFCSLMRPDDLEYAADMTHHTKAELAAAPFPIDVFKKFKEFIGNDILVGHNVSFDINFIYNLPENDVTEKAMLDCENIYSLFKSLHKDAMDQCGSIDSFKALFKKHKKTAKDIVPENYVLDEDSPFFGKTVVFTGVLEKMKRTAAMQIVVNMGGICKDSVTSKVNYLVLGNNEDNLTLKGNKSSKLIKAEKMIEDGKDLTILSENLFYDMLEEYNQGNE